MSKKIKRRIQFAVYALLAIWFIVLHVAAWDDYQLRQWLVATQAEQEISRYNAEVYHRGQIPMNLQTSNGQVMMDDIAIKDSKGTINYGCRVVDGGDVNDPSAALAWRPPIDRPRSRLKRNSGTVFTR